MAHDPGPPRASGYGCVITARNRGFGNPHLASALAKVFGGACLACGGSFRRSRNRKGLQPTIDHVVPRAKGGTTSLANLQPLCEPCNADKGTKKIDYRPRELRTGHEVSQALIETTDPASWVWDSVDPPAKPRSRNPRRRFRVSIGEELQAKGKLCL